MNDEQSRFIDRLFKDLYKEESVVRHGTGNVNDKFKNIKTYMAWLEALHTKVSDTGDFKHRRNLLKKIYYDSYIISASSIPESYYKHQQEIALERGYGHIEMTDKIKKQYQEQIIDDQKKSLDSWLDYFLSKDADVYPFWAKYWAFQGMLKLDVYDPEKGEFGKRRNDTVAPFPELNREALAISIDLVTKFLDKEEIDDKTLETLVKSGSFRKIYSYAVTDIQKNKKKTSKNNEGIWIKYDQGSDHMMLVNSLKGYNTGWCTAGETVAKEQLANGDFYVYYTLDENGEYKVPRIAIRMEYGSIAEIRGIEKDQNLESGMEEVVEEKIKDFPDKEEYYKKVSDMKMLTAIYKKHQNKEELTMDELRFLYEIDDEIIGFGFNNDPRINDIIYDRKRSNGKKHDLSLILNCSEEQIAFSEAELNDDTVYYEGDIDLRYVTNVEELKLPKYVKGSLNLSGLTSTEGLVLPKYVKVSLDLSGLTNAEGLVLPERVKNIYLRNLIHAEKLKFPKKMHFLWLGSLKTFNGLQLPECVDGTLSLGLESAQGLVLPKRVYRLDMSHLRSAEGVVFPQHIKENCELDGLQRFDNLVLPEYIGGDLCIKCYNIDGAVFPRKIGKSLDFRFCNSIKNSVLPDYIGKDLNFRALKNIENVVFPSHIGDNLTLKYLKNIDGVIFPEKIKYTIYYGENGIVTSENVHEYRNNPQNNNTSSSKK